MQRHTGVREMSKKRIFNPTERVGVNVCAQIFTSFEWIFREQLVADFGIDAQVEITEAGAPTGHLLGLQIKTGESYFRGSGEHLFFYADEAHMNYWCNHILPIVLILHDPKSGITLWQWAHPDFSQETDKGWRIEFTLSNILDAQAKDALKRRGSSDAEFARRQRFAADKSFMKEFVGREAYVTIDVWVNKSLHIREIEFRFGDPDKEHPNFTQPVMVTWGYDVDDVMRHFFPWLEYYADGEVEDTAGEIETHRFNVVLTEAAKGFLLAEEYFKEGLPEPSDPSDQDEGGGADDEP
jgi:hypothetical protein